MPTTTKVLTQEEVRQFLDYAPETGELRWRAARGNRKMGGVAGSTNAAGYLLIGISGKRYRAHRIIWLWFYGYFPETDIDHINRVKSDNRIENLREVSQTCNSRNCEVSGNNKSGVKGISWCIMYGKWLSKITAANKHKHIGRHTDLTEAVAHRLAAEQCLDWEGCDNNSSAYQYMKRVGVI